MFDRVQYVPLNFCLLNFLYKLFQTYIILKFAMPVRPNFVFDFYLMEVAFLVFNKIT